MPVFCKTAIYTIVLNIYQTFTCIVGGKNNLPMPTWKCVEHNIFTVHLSKCKSRWEKLINGFSLYAWITLCWKHLDLCSLDLIFEMDVGKRVAPCWQTIHGFLFISISAHISLILYIYKRNCIFPIQYFYG